MINIRKTVDISLPQFFLKILKIHLLKTWFTWLVYISLYLLPYLIFAEVSFTCNLRRFNLSVIIFLIPLLSSNSLKILFSNTLLVPETTFHFRAKISIVLFWPTSSDTKSLFTLLTSGVKPWRLFLRKIFPAATRAWSKINYGDESNCFPDLQLIFCMLSGKSFFLFD